MSPSTVPTSSTPTTTPTSVPTSFCFGKADEPLANCQVTKASALTNTNVCTDTRPIFVQGFQIACNLSCCEYLQENPDLGGSIILTPDFGEDDGEGLEANDEEVLMVQFPISLEELDEEAKTTIKDEIRTQVNARMGADVVDSVDLYSGSLIAAVSFKENTGVAEIEMLSITINDKPLNLGGLNASSSSYTQKRTKVSNSTAFAPAHIAGIAVAIAFLMVVVIVVIVIVRTRQTNASAKSVRNVTDEIMTMNPLYSPNEAQYASVETVETTARRTVYVDPKPFPTDSSSDEHLYPGFDESSDPHPYSTSEPLYHTASSSQYTGSPVYDVATPC